MISRDSTPAGAVASVWLDSYSDPVAGITTNSQLLSAPLSCMCAYGCSSCPNRRHRSPEGTQRSTVDFLTLQLLVGDLGTTGEASVKVWEGRGLSQTARLQEQPVALAA